MIAESENITREITTDGRLVFEPGYAAYLRAEGYTVDDIHSIDTIASDSEPDKKYLVAKIDTYDLPKGHDDLDVVADGVTVPVCTCWNWRSEHSADLENATPTDSGVCKHLKSAYKSLKAANDDNQETL